MSIETDRLKLYTLTQADVTQHLKTKNLSRAISYRQRGQVTEAVIEDTTLYALVEEDRNESYSVEITMENGDLYAVCSCPYERMDWCAHIGAVLLTWIQDRDSFSQASSTDTPQDEPLDAPQEQDQAAQVQEPDFKREYREMLARQTINDLRTIAQTRGIVIKGNRKAPIVNELSVHLGDLKATREQVLALDDLKCQILTFMHLILIPGYGFSAESIITELTSKYGGKHRNVIHSQIVELSRRGLLLSFKQNNLVYYSVPQIVRVCLPPRPDLVSAYPEPKIKQLAIHETRLASLIQTIYGVWNYLVEHHPLSPPAPERHPIEEQWPQLQGWDHVPSEVEELAKRKRHYYNIFNQGVTVPVPAYHLPAADRRALHDVTEKAHPGEQQVTDAKEQIEFCYSLLAAIGAISEKPGQPIVTVEERFQHVLRLPPSKQANILLHAWLQSDTWSEMNILLRSTTDIRLHRTLMYPTYKPADMYKEWRTGRKTVLRFLSTLQENRWVSVDGFLQTLYQINPDFMHQHSDRSVWWLESLKTKKQFGTTFEDWQNSHGQFILATLQGPLAWFGAVSLGYKGNKLKAFKLTQVGSFALQRRTTLVEGEQQAGHQDATHMGENLTLTLIPGRTPAQLHDLLHVIGKLQEATPEQFTYRITADGVLHALEQGQTIESLSSLLNQLCGKPIPPTWQKKLHTWSQNYGKLHVYQDITLIELADDYALKELLVNTSLREKLVYQFSPRLLAIQSDAVDQLVNEMEKRGYTPRVE